ncbi:unnamed protein product [Rhizoctonia solani]|uniref:Transcriptional coactivator p15 (PC4) C-terminal domain-containing protein n=1 Tax=Rhizoctonia solani TaxID=456999 RepID=A0A8H3D6G1_9AGAM|nr:unnamed protein product [Rhizoctonia solani]
MAHKRTRKVESDEESSADEAPVLSKKPASGSVSVPVPDKQTNAEGDTYFEISGKRRVTVRAFNGLKLVDIREISGKRRVTVRAFNGLKLVDIREMYTDKASGELRPGKKGISLSEEQFMGLVNVHGAISQALNDLDVGSSKSAKPAKITKAKASTSKESKPASKSKPAAKKKARKEESEEEDDE